MRKALIAVTTLTMAFVLSTAAPASASVSIVPSKVEQQVRPGQETTFAITFLNDSQSAFSVGATAWDFARDDRGQAQPITRADSVAFRGCADWVHMPMAPTQASPGKKVEVPLVVNVPGDAAPGSYHTYVRFLAAPAQNANGTMGVAYAINALVVLTVVPDGGVAAITSADSPTLRRSMSIGALSVPGTAMNGVVPVRATLINDGNVHIDVKPRFEILDTGGRVVETLLLKEFTLLPGDRYPLETTWSKPPMLGQYSVRLVVGQSGGQTLTASAPLLIVSWTAVLVALAGLLILSLSVLVFRRYVHIELRAASTRPVADPR